MNRTTLSISLMLVAWGAPAFAESTKMFPLSSAPLPAELAQAPDRLTRALAASIEADVASAPLEDAAGLLDCELAATACLETVARSVGAQRLVFGVLAVAANGEATVTLTRFEVGAERVTRTLVLASQDLDGWSRDLVRESGPMFGRAKPAPAAPASIPEVPLVAGDEGGQGASAARGPTTGTWVMIGSGVATLAVGTGFLISARGIAGDVDRAPRDSLDDFERLVALEDRGRVRSRVGQVLVGVGGVAITAGIVRAILQRRRGPGDASAIRLEPAIVDGGAAIVLSVGAR